MLVVVIACCIEVDHLHARVIDCSFSSLSALFPLYWSVCYLFLASHLLDKGDVADRLYRQYFLTSQRLLRQSKRKCMVTLLFYIIFLVPMHVSTCNIYTQTLTPSFSVAYIMLILMEPVLVCVISFSYLTQHIPCAMVDALLFALSLTFAIQSWADYPSSPRTPTQTFAHCYTCM